MKIRHGLVFSAAVLFAAVTAVATASAAERTVKLAVEKMTCVACPYMVKKSLAAVDGIADVKVSFESKTAVVTFDDSKATVRQLTNATLERGYPSKEVKQGG